MRLYYLLLGLLGWLPSSISLKVEYSQQYPLGSGPENLALRASGAVLTTINTNGPYIYQVEPVKNADPKLVYTFKNSYGASGITATSIPDLFYVVTGHYNFSSFQPVAGSYAIHRLSFDKHDKAVSQELGPLSIGQSNGIINVPGTEQVLLADSYDGFIYKYNAATRKQTLYFDHPLLKPDPAADQGLSFGVNGVKLTNGYLYFSNTNQRIIARIKATGLEQQLHGTPEIVVKDVPSDDFIVDPENGDVFMAEQTPINGLGFLSHRKYGSQPETIYGGVNTTSLLGPTAVTIAKDSKVKAGEKCQRTLLVTIGGNFFQYVTGNYTGGAYLAIVHLDN